MHSICRLKVVLAEHVRNTLISREHCFLNKPRCLSTLSHRDSNWLVILVKYYACFHALKIY